MTDLPGEDGEDAIRRMAVRMAGGMAARGLTADEARRLAATATSDPGDGLLWAGIAAEITAIEAEAEAAEARGRFRVVDGEATGRRNPPAGRA